MRSARVWRRWTVAWLGGSLLGVANGAARELAYKDRAGEAAARQISSGTLIGLLAVYFWTLERRWPIPTTRSALEIGATWAILTVLFEFGFGRYADRKSWSELAEDYKLAEGRAWLLVLVWIGAGPAVIRKLAG